MVDLTKEIDFSAEMEKDPSLLEFLHKAAQEISNNTDFESIKKPQLDLQFKNDVIVGGLPTVEQKHVPMLITVFKKYLNREKVGQEDGLIQIKLGSLPGEKHGSAAYLTYQTSEQAETCVGKIDNLKFDAKHTLDCFFLQRVGDVMNLPKEYQQKEIPKIKTLQSYNNDRDYRDQIMYREQTTVNIGWFENMKKLVVPAIPSMNLEKVKKVQFSVNGTYLAALFDDGVRLYAGENMREENFYPHSGVRDIQFSPNQKYLLSFNGALYAPIQQNFIVWNVAQASKLRSFKAQQSQTVDSFKFSSDSQFIAGVFIDNEIVSIFELPTMQMLKDPVKNVKSAIPVSNIKKIHWHSTRNLLICMAYPRMGDKPASKSSTKITLIEIPSRTEIKWKNWAHDAGNGFIHVATSGDWVAIVMGKLAKKKITTTCIQIANFRKKDLEIDTLDIPEKVINVSFDCYNNRFAVVYKEDTGAKDSAHIQQKFHTLFYSIEEEKGSQEIRQFGKVSGTMTRNALLASNGVFFALINTDKESSSRGNWVLGYLNKDSSKNKITVETIRSGVMMYMSYCQFDPSGRFLVLGSQENRSIQIWTVLGQMIWKDSMTVGKSINDVCWRPRKRNLLDPKSEKALTDDWKNIKQRFEQQDKEKNNAIQSELEQKKRKYREDFLKYLEKKRQFFATHKDVMQKLRGIDEATARTAKLQVREQIIIVDHTKQ